MRNSCRRFETTSSTRTLFPQFHRPMRSGVCTLIVVVRSSAKSGRVPTGVVSPGCGGTNNVPAALWKVCELVNVNWGDQLTHDATFTADGASRTSGNVWLTRPFDSSWLRFPPSVNEPQEKRLSKFTLDPSRAVARLGSRLLRN